MTLFVLVVAGIFIMYAAFMIYFLTGLSRLTTNISNNNSYEPIVSVIIAARNEESNLPFLLEDLCRQSYPKDKYQIIIVDDRSTDSTWSIINKFSENNTNVHGVQISEKSSAMTPKKHALTKAIEESTGEIIISTDADCRVPDTWIRSTIDTFDDKTGVIVGYSKIDTSSERFIDHFQSIDYLALMSANAGTLGWGNPWTGSGQNIAYSRSLFNNIGGFNLVADRVSGDDFYLVQSISKIAKVRYNVNSTGFVQTKPMDGVRQFLNQRIRWASNTRKLFNTDWFFLLFLFTNLFTNTILLSILFLKNYWHLIPMLFGLKFLIDSFVIFYGSKIFRTQIKINVYLIWFFIQPLYTPMLGILSMIGKYRWKT